MRKNSAYYYKSYDRINFNEIERITNECFNDYGFNLGSNKRREFDYDDLLSKTNCQSLKKMIKSKKNVNG